MGFWSTIGDAFGRDGGATKFLEKIPVVGYGVAIGQVIAGNPDHAKRAAAASTNSVLTTAGVVGGFCVGGPVGAVAGGALASQVGIGAEWAISKSIDDESIKDGVGEVSLKRNLTDAVLGTSGIIGGGAGVTAIGKVLRGDSEKGREVRYD